MEQALVLRARIVLTCAGGRSKAEVAALRWCKQAVDEHRSRFLTQHLDRLLDEEWSGVPR